MSWVLRERKREDVEDRGNSQVKTGRHEREYYVQRIADGFVLLDDRFYWKKWQEVRMGKWVKSHIPS